MRIWYEIEKENKVIDSFLHIFSSFHDYSIENINFIRSKKVVDINLNGISDRVCLRFIDVENVHLGMLQDIAYDWINEAMINLLENGNLLWSDYKQDTYECFNNNLKEDTWVESGRIIWSATDNNGNSIEFNEFKKCQISEEVANKLIYDDNDN